MENQYTATQVGSYFVDQYYKVFNYERDHAHKFYSDESSVLIIDGKIKSSASKIAPIQELIASSTIMGIEIKTTNSLESLNRGVLVVVSGSVESREFSGSREFVQTFFLAPQDKGSYFVLNDVFHFANKQVEQRFSSPEQDFDCQSTDSLNLPETPESGDALEENAVECASLVHTARDESAEESVLPEPIQDQHTLTNGQEPEETAEQTEKLDHGNVQELEPFAEQSEKLTYATVQEPRTSVEELDEQHEKPNHDTIPVPQSPSEELKPESSTDCAVQELQPFVEELPQLFEKSAFPTLRELYRVAEQCEKLNHDTAQKLQSSSEETVGQVETPSYARILQVKGISQPSISNGVASTPFLKELTPTLPKFGDSKEQRSGESNSVYVKNLPSTVTTLDVLYELRNFGKIKPDGVFVRNHQGSGASSAFVEFEDSQGAINAIKASPIRMDGRRVYIEQRRSNFGASRGGRRVEHFDRSFVKDNVQNGSVRANGFRRQ